MEWQQQQHQHQRQLRIRWTTQFSHSTIAPIKICGFDCDLHRMIRHTYRMLIEVDDADNGIKCNSVAHEKNENDMAILSFYDLLLFFFPLQLLFRRIYMCARARLLNCSLILFSISRAKCLLLIVHLEHARAFIHFQPSTYTSQHPITDHHCHYVFVPYHLS